MQDNRPLALKLRTVFVFGLSLLASLTPFHSVSASIFNEDDRVAGANDSGSLDSIGIVRETLRGGYATVFLVGECYALSAKHVVHNPEPVGRPVTLRFELWERASASNSTKGVVVAAGGQPEGIGDVSKDWILIRLDRCLGRSLGYLTLSEDVLQIPGSGQITPSLRAVGYPRDRPLSSHPTVDPACRVKLISSYGLLHDCATLPGNSGGPLLGWNSKRQQLQVFAINVAGYDDHLPRSFDQNRANAAVAVQPIIAILALFDKPSKQFVTPGRLLNEAP